LKKLKLKKGVDSEEGKKRRKGKRKRAENEKGRGRVMGFKGVEERGKRGRKKKDFWLFITCKRTNVANNATHYIKLDKEIRESSKRNYYTQ